MNQAKHTPGPWRLSEPDPIFGDYTIQPPNEELAIAAVVNGEMRRMGGKLDEHRANAQIVAAAPLLLDACNVALGHLTGGMDGDWRDCDPRDLLRNAIDAAIGQRRA